MSYLLVPLVVAGALFLALWPVSVWRKDASLVDLVWGPGFIVQAIVAAYFVPALGDHGVVLLILIGVWSLRLAWTLGRRRWIEGHEDARYTSLRASWNPGFWWKSLAVVFGLQAVLQWLIIVGPLTALHASDAPVALLSVLGIAVALCGLALETIADLQLDRFKAANGPRALFTGGLRARARHPNYVGEILFWVGIALVCLDAGAWAGLLSPVLITVFLLRVSGVPLLEERLSETRPDYQAYKSRVPALIPDFRTLRPGYSTPSRQ